MAELGVVNVATDVYEQRLLATGLLEDKSLGDRLRDRFAAISGVRTLYWHVIVMTPEERKRDGRVVYDLGQTFWLDASAGLRLVGAAGVADVNFRVATDALGTVYVLGRARSPTERDAALDAVRRTAGARRVVSYVEVRP
jgi:hyperosmotically inducible protein